jgi:hypothetical protein
MRNDPWFLFLAGRGGPAFGAFGAWAMQGKATGSRLERQPAGTFRNLLSGRTFALPKPVSSPANRTPHFPVIWDNMGFFGYQWFTFGKSCPKAQFLTQPK